MKIFIRKCLLLLCIYFALYACSTLDDEVSGLLEVAMETSEQGIVFSHIQEEDAENIIAQVYWPNNWAYDSALNPLIPLMATRLIYSGGAEGADSGELAEQLERLRVERSLNSDSVSVVGSLVFPAEYSSEVAELINMVLLRPAFEPEILDRVKRSAHARINRSEQQIDEVAGEISRNIILNESPVRRMFSLSSETSTFVDGATRDEIREFHAQVLTRTGAWIVVHSPFGGDRVGQFLDKLLDDLPEGKAVDYPDTTIDFPYGGTVVLHDPDAERSYLGFTGVLPPVSQGREFEDVISLILFAQGGRSDLYEALRSELGASYEFNANALPLSKDVRILQIAGFVDTDKLKFAHETIKQTYENFRNSGPGSSLDGIKLRLSTNLQNVMRSPRILVPLVMESLVNGFPATRAFEHHDEIEAITEDSLIDRLQKDFPSVDQLLTVIVTSNPDLIPGACVIEDPEDYRECL